MQRLVHQVAGQNVVVNRVESEDDLVDFREFVRKNRRILACDSEATGLDMYSPTFRLRLVQFGNQHESYVIPVERGGQFVGDVVGALKFTDKLVFQNGGFDLQVFNQTLGVPMESLWPKVTDTKILAHLVDPRGQEDGGVGHGLEGLTGRYIDPEVAKNVKGLMTKLAKEYKTTKSKIWSAIDLDHPEYNLYAGMDTILAARLYNRLWPEVPAANKSTEAFDGMTLVQFEHKVAEICSYMERTGFLLDVEYAENLSKRLHIDEERWEAVALDFGVKNVNSADQVADGLEAMGVRIEGRTPSGKRQVDKKLLAELIKAENPLAKAVVEAKKARKWRTTWVDGFLANRDSNDRCHANINSLKARTGRMSITGIPAQTLPSGEWMIRRCFVADPGHFIGSIDYNAQELRVLAALSGDATMIEAFGYPVDDPRSDLHLITARAAFGEHITKDHKERKYAKTVNFGRVYGGGVNTVMEQTGLDRETAKRVVDGFDNAYPGVKIYSNKLMRLAQSQGYIVTPIGRRVPVDPDRAYAALNYMVQGTSRDVTCRGLVKLHKDGFTPYLRLPVHDEVVASLPMDKAKWGADQIGIRMNEWMGPVNVNTDPAVPGKSWGHEYMRLPNSKPDTELQKKADLEIQAAGLW